VSASEKLKALLHKAETAPRGWDNDIHGEPLLGALPEILAVVEAAEIAQQTVPVPAFGEPGFAAAKARDAALAALDEALA
jgi:hypothetical protein